VVLLPLSSGVTINETALWISDLSKSAAQQGLYFTLLLFLTSLGTVAHPPSRPQPPEQLLASQALSPDRSGSFSEGSSVDELSWLSPPKQPSPLRTNSRRTSSGGHSSSHKRDSYGSLGVSRTATSRQSSLPAWAQEQPRDSGRASSAGSGEWPSRSLVCDTSSPISEDKNHPSWLNSPSKFPAVPVRPPTSTASRAVQLLCRSYIDTPLEDEADLIASHPCSSKFFSFFGLKFLYFVLCLAVVTMQVIVTYPSLFGAVFGPLLSRNNSSALVVEKVLFVGMSTAVVACRLSWIASIYKATHSSALKLKETKYMQSRYQQLAFRLFLNQILVGLSLLLLSYLILFARSALLIYHGYKHDLSANTAGLDSPSFDGEKGVSVGSGRHWTSLAGLWHELYTMMSASFEEGFGVWGGKNSELGELLYVACICYTITFLFSPPLHGNELDSLRHDEALEDDDRPSNNLYLQNDLGLAGHAYAYDALEMSRADVTDPWNGRHVSTPFCLESALLLMECSWQTYYIAPPRDEEERDLDEPEELPPAARIPSVASSCSSESQPLLTTRSSTSEPTDGFFSGVLGSSQAARMDVAQYGLTLVKSFCNAKGDIAGFVARDDYFLSASRTILSFRGTADASNMLTDLNFLQTTVDKQMLNIDHDSLQRLVEGVARDMTEKKEAAAKKQRHKNKTTRRSPRGATSNPFAVDDERASLSGPRSKSDITRRTSLNPFDEDEEQTGSRSVGGTSMANDDNLPDPLVAAAADTSSSNSSAQGRGLLQLPDPVPNTAAMSSCPCCLPSVMQRKHPRVHSGFYRAYLTIRTTMYIAVIEALTQHLEMRQQDAKNPFCDEEERAHLLTRPLEVHICGHSLGGALAVLASLDLSQNLKLLMSIVQRKTAGNRNTESKLGGLVPLPPPRLLVYSFGSPRVGNKAFTRWLRKQVPDMFRVEVDGDLICRVPHVMYTCGSYHHAGTHVLVAADKTGNFMINPNVVEKHFLRRGTGTADHHSLTQYRACVEACLSPDERHFYRHKYHWRGTQLTSDMT